MPRWMQAVEYRGAGGPEVVHLTDRERPEPGPGEVLLGVVAAGVNRPDVLQRRGHYPPPEGASDIPGLEVSGRVERVGPNVRTLSVGDEVCALVTGGGYATHCLAQAQHCLPLPPKVSLEDAASLPETYFTVWTNLFEDGALDRGGRALVHGGAGGIGTTAILLAKSFGAEVAVTAGSEQRCAFCRDLGADLAVDYRTEDFVDAVRAWSPRGVDVVLDMIGGDYIARNLACLAPRGRHVSVAFLRGQTAELNLMKLMRNRWTLTGSTLRSREDAEKARIAGELRGQVWPRFDGRGLRPVISDRLPLAGAADAQRLLETSQQLGKVVLLTS